MAETARSYQAVLRTQTEVNARTMANAALYADHRQRLTDEVLALAPAPADGRLCLLGAGNCNDVDLARLAERYREIHLVDLDAAALTRGYDRQEPAVRDKLTRHAAVDLTGLLPTLDRWLKRPPSQKELDAAITAGADDLCRRLPAPFEVVASCCVSTQLAHGITSTLGVNHPLLPDARHAVATIHLRTMAGLLSLGGEALFVSDMVSSETYPLEELTPGRDLKDVMSDLVAAGNFILGADPALQSRILRRDPPLKERAAPARQLSPWLWRPVKIRTFLVYGFVFERRA